MLPTATAGPESSGKAGIVLDRVGLLLSTRGDTLVLPRARQAPGASPGLPALRYIGLDPSSAVSADVGLKPYVARRATPGGYCGWASETGEPPWFVLRPANVLSMRLFRGFALGSLQVG